MSLDKFKPKMSQDEDTDDVRKFFDDWGLYWRVVEYDCAGHKEIYGRLNSFLKQHFPEPFNIIDFGCGDASYMVRGLAGTRVRKYLGVDISEVALGLARENLEGLGYETGFIRGDYFQIAREKELGADVIWIGLSFHHLSSGQKREVLGEFRSILGNAGYLLIFEPMLRGGETREEFLRRFEKLCRTEWIRLSPQEREATIEHVISADFPESIETLKKMALENGFSTVRSLCRAGHELFELVCFSVEPGDAEIL